MMAIICQAHTDISPLPTVNDVTSRWLVCATAWFIGWYMNIWWKFTTKFLLTMFGRAGKTKGCPARWPERNGLLKKLLPITPSATLARERERERVNDHRGIPIGSLTSQIFANIYLNELDRLVKHILKPQFYLRYGDDFIIIAPKREIVENMRKQMIFFLNNSLGLVLNPKNDIILPVRRGIHFLGVEIYPTGRRLKNRIWQRAQIKLNERNISSYSGLIKQNFTKKIPYFDWLITKIYD